MRGTYVTLMVRPGDVLVKFSYLIAIRDCNYVMGWPGDVLVTSLTWPLLVTLMISPDTTLFYFSYEDITMLLEISMSIT